jgi:Leucine-rich repeat (LRR) protein
MADLDGTLSYLELGSNKLSGPIPLWISSMTNLTYLGLHRNDFTGSIPTTILKSLRALVGIDLSYNRLTGNLSTLDGFSCPPNLTYIYVKQNQLNHSIHDGSFSYCESLTEINFSNNNMTGSFPQHFYDYKFVDMNQNNLTGRLMNVSNDVKFQIEYLSIANNALTGQIPPSILSLDQLLYLDLSNNRLSGSLDAVFSDQYQLNYSIASLFLFNNPFEMGPIPQLMNATNLRELSLSETNRNGPIPSWIGTLANLTFLDLHNNMLNGSLPLSLGDLNRLEYVFLSNNDLTGQIPSSFVSFANNSTIKSFYINRNSITGSLDVVCGTETEVDTNKVIIADCLEPIEISCTCCKMCCNDNVEQCN